MYGEYDFVKGVKLVVVYMDSVMLPFFCSMGSSIAVYLVHVYMKVQRKVINLGKTNY